MKRLLPLFLLQILAIGIVNAQSANTNPKKEKFRTLLGKAYQVSKATKATKTRALDDRLIAEVYEETAVDDSITYSYSGTRGSQLEVPFYTYFENQDYDLSVDYDFASGPGANSKSYCTYTADDKLLTQPRLFLKWTECLGTRLSSNEYIYSRESYQLTYRKLEWVNLGKMVAKQIILITETI